MKILIACNPAAGAGRALSASRQALRLLRDQGAEASLIIAENREHLAHVAAHEGPQHDRFVVAGGDGTLHHALRDLDLERTVVGILPLGSGDDLARALGIPARLHTACDVIMHGEVRRIDVATVNSRRFLGIASLGLDSAVARWVNERPRPGSRSLVYLWALARVLPSYRPVTIFITLDGRTVEQNVMLAVVANNSRYGGGIRIAPTARLDDGLLDLHVVRECSRAELLATLPLAYRGKHMGSRLVWWKREPVFEIDSDEPLDVFADGEYVTQTPAAFGLEPHPMQVVVPR